MGSALDSTDMKSYVDPLIELAKALKPKTVLEIGIGYDAYSTQIWLRETDCKLVTVDKEDWGDWEPRLTTIAPDRFTFVKERSEEALPKFKPVFDLIYIDGDHSYEGVKADIINSMKLVTDGVILIDDYGVTFPSATDIVNGSYKVDFFGIKQAVDELFDKTWERVYTDIQFGNGAVAFRRKRVAPKSRKR